MITLLDTLLDTGLDLGFRKKIRRRLINIYLYFLSFIKLPPNMLGLFIKIAHFNTPITVLGLMIICPRIVAYLLTTVIWWIVMIFFYFNGCFLSVVEYKLDNQDITMMDPVIYMCGDKVTKQTRNTYSLYIGICYVFTLMCIMKLRFDPQYYVFPLVFICAMVILVVNIAMLSTDAVAYFDTDIFHPMIKSVRYYKSTEHKTLIKTQYIY